MKNFFTRLFLPVFILTLLSSERASATHLAGFDLQYVCIDGAQDIYQVRLRLYTDGCGIAPPGSVTISLTSACGQVQQITLGASPTVDVTPLCQNFQNQTCCGGGFISCFLETTYVGNIDLTGCNTWTMSAQDCCRNNAINNLQNPGAAGIYIETVYSTAQTFPCNTSVNFGEQPIIFACPDQTVVYNPLATDADGDSLAFSFIAPRDNANIFIGFVNPYNLNNPFPLNGPLIMDVNTGVMTFVPTTPGNYVIAVEVREYRNGLLVSTSYRDIQILVLPPNLCQLASQPPVGAIDNVGGATSSPNGLGSDFWVCPGNTVSFTLQITDPDLEQLNYITNVNSIPGATLTMTPTANGDTLNGVFSVNTANFQPGDVYSFYIIATDSACPVPNFLSYYYTLNMIQLDGSTSNEYICTNNLNVLQLSTDGLGPISPPGTYQWSPVTGLSDPTLPNPVATISQPIVYTVNYTDGACTLTDVVNIYPSPLSLEFPNPLDTTICDGNNAQLNVAGSIDTGPPTISFTNTTTTPVVGGTTVNIPINVTGINPLQLNAGQLASVCLNVSAAITGQINIFLISPSGVSIQLSTGNGGFGNAGYNNTCFNPLAGTSITAYVFSPIPANVTVRPEQGNGFTNFVGGNVNGVWTLQIVHTVNNGGACTFNNVTMTFNNLNNPTFTWAPNNGLTCYNCPNPVANVNQTTTWDVTAVNLIGCSDTTQYTVYIAAGLPAPTVFCDTTTNTSVTFGWNPVGGADSYSISIDGGPFINVGLATTYTVNGLAQGQTVNIEVIANTAPGSPCLSSPSGTISCTASNCPTFSPPITGNLVLCVGANTVLTGPQGYVLYQWSNGLTGPSITVNTPQVVQLTVTDANGCTGTNAVTVTNTPVNVAITGNVSDCPGGSSIISASPGFTSYAWSNGLPATQTVTVTTPGTYTVTATSANGCTATGTFNFSFFTPPAPTINGSTTICNGASTTLNAGAFSAYSWSTGETTASIIVGAAGQVCVTVTDANGCTGSACVTITLATNLTPSIGANGPLVFCQGNTVVLDGGVFDNFVWSNGPTTQTITVNASGTYTVTVSNANGCTGTDAVTVTVNPVPTVALGPDVAYCLGDSTTLTAVPTGGTPAYTYAWNLLPGTGDTYTVQPVATTTYVVTLTDQNGCTATDSEVVTVNANPTVNAGQDVSICNGVSTTLTATANGGGAPYTFTWDAPLGVGASHVVAPFGTTTYGVSVSDANGCTGSDNVLVTVNPPLSVDAGTDLSICVNSDVTINAIASGGTPNISYSWTGPNGFVANTASITINNAQGAQSGVYTVLITDAAGCTASNSMTLTVSNQLLVNILPNGPTTFCAGGNVILDAGVFDTYTWTTGETTQNIQVSTSGTYRVTVSDVQGCTGTGSITVVENQNPTTNAGTDIGFCDGLSGTLTPSASGGTAPYVFNWSNGQQGVITVSPTPGNYLFDVTVTDANGCTATDQVGVTVHQNPTAILPADTTVCFNSTLPVTAQGSDGTAPYSFVWSTGDVTQTANILITGAFTYTVTVTDANGCSGSETIDIDTISSILFNIGAPSGTIFCDGNSVLLDAGPGYFAYNWSNGETTQTIIVDNSGTFTVSVTDFSVCQGTSNITVTELLPISTTANITNVSCTGGNNGVIDLTGLTIGGTGNYVAYAWSNGQVTQTATNLVAGSYSVTVTDSQGCTGTGTFVVSEPATAVGVSITGANATCNGVANGVGIANPFGGTPNYTYAWSNGAVSDTAVGLAANVPYIVTVTDQNGCIALDTVIVDEPTAITLIITNVVATLCHNSTDGRARVNASGGTPGYTYQWNNGETTALATALAAGNATVTVGDAQGCTVTATVTINEPSPVNMNIVNLTLPECSGTATGSVIVVGTGGTPPYIGYQWDFGAGAQTTAAATGLPAGIYTVTITDFHGCTFEGSITMPDPAPLVASIQIDTLIRCNGDTTGALSTNVSGGTGSYTYDWSNGESTPSLNGLGAGSYAVTVTDAGGCTAADAVVLDEPELLVLTADAVGIRCNGGNDGEINLSGAGGRLPYEYSIDGGDSWQNGSNFPGLGSDTFQVAIRDNYGCMDTMTMWLENPDSFIVSIFPIDTTIEFGDTVTLAITTNAPATYDWVLDTTLSCLDCPAPIAQPHFTTVYHATVTDTNGCFEIVEARVQVTFRRRVYVANLFTPNNDGHNDVFLVQGGRGVQSVRAFRVYDRWGEMVWQSENVAPNDPSGGWNGQFKGKPVPPGVFVWYAEIVYDDGFTEVIKGDVTLVK